MRVYDEVALFCKFTNVYLDSKRRRLVRRRTKEIKSSWLSCKVKKIAIEIIYRAEVQNQSQDSYLELAGAIYSLWPSFHVDYNNYWDRVTEWQRSERKIPFSEEEIIAFKINENVYRRVLPTAQIIFAHPQYDKLIWSSLSYLEELLRCSTGVSRIRVQLATAIIRGAPLEFRNHFFFSSFHKLILEIDSDTNIEPSFEEMMGFLRELLKYPVRDCHFDLKVIMQWFIRFLVNKRGEIEREQLQYLFHLSLLTYQRSKLNNPHERLLFILLEVWNVYSRIECPRLKAMKERMLDMKMKRAISKNDCCPHSWEIKPLKCLAARSLAKSAQRSQFKDFSIFVSAQNKVVTSAIHFVRCHSARTSCIDEIMAGKMNKLACLCKFLP